MTVSSQPPMSSDSAKELITTQVTQADINWLRAAKVEWDACEAGAPIIEPTSTGLFSRGGRQKFDTLLPVFFLHARFGPGVYDIGADSPFEVTADHVKLLKVASWEGAAIDCKRPYGDFTNFPIDMARALGLPITAGADRIARISPEDNERMVALHLQMQKVVTAYVRHAVWAPGAYLAPRGGLEPTGAARPRLVAPTQAEFERFLKDMPAARKATESWRVYSVIAELYAAP